MYYEELTIITLIAFTLVGLYGLGSLINRLKSNKYLKTVWKQLKKLGKQAEYKNLGSSGFIITINDVNKNTKRIDISVLLGKREFPLNWIIDKLRKKDDTFSLNIIYHRQIYNMEVTLVRPGNYYGDTYIKYHKEYLERDGFYIYPKSINLDRKINQLLKIVRKYEHINMLTIKPNRKSVLLIANIRIITNLSELLEKLINL